MPGTQQDDQLEQLTRMLDLPQVKLALENNLKKEREELENRRREAIAELQAAETKLTTQDLPPIDARIAVAKIDLEKAKRQLEAASSRLAEAQRDRSATTARFDHQKNKIRLFLSRTASAAVAEWSVELQNELVAFEKTVPTERREESGSYFRGRPVVRFFSNRASRERRVRMLRRLLHRIHEISCECATTEEVQSRIEQLRLTIPPVEMEQVK